MRLNILTWSCRAFLQTSFQFPQRTEVQCLADQDDRNLDNNLDNPTFLDSPKSTQGFPQCVVIGQVSIQRIQERHFAQIFWPQERQNQQHYFDGQVICKLAHEKKRPSWLFESWIEHVPVRLSWGFSLWFVSTSTWGSAVVSLHCDGAIEAIWSRFRDVVLSSWVEVEYCACTCGSMVSQLSG